jgi:hypothetical protein
MDNPQILKRAKILFYEVGDLIMDELYSERFKYDKDIHIAHQISTMADCVIQAEMLIEMLGGEGIPFKTKDYLHYKKVEALSPLIASAAGNIMLIAATEERNLDLLKDLAYKLIEFLKDYCITRYVDTDNDSWRCENIEQLGYDRAKQRYVEFVGKGWRPMR